MVGERENTTLVYSEECWRRFQAPAHSGPPPGEVAVGRGRARGRSGDTEVWIWLARQGHQAWFLAHGCPWTIAGADLAAEWWSGGVNPLERPGELAAVLQAPSDRMDVFLTIEDAFRAALEAASDKNHGGKHGDYAD